MLLFLKEIVVFTFYLPEVALDILGAGRRGEEMADRTQKNPNETNKRKRQKETNSITLLLIGMTKLKQELFSGIRTTDHFQ